MKSRDNSFNYCGLRKSLRKIKINIENNNAHFFFSQKKIFTNEFACKNLLIKESIWIESIWIFALKIKKKKIETRRISRK